MINGAVTIGAGAILSAGNRALPAAAIGNLTTGPLTLSLGSTFEAVVASGTSYSTLNAGPFTTDISGAAFSILLTPGATFANGTILHQVIASDISNMNTGVGSTMFTNSTYTTGGYTFTADYNTDAGFFDVDVAAVPEPASWAGILVMGLMGVSQRRKLQAWLRLARK